MRKLTRVLLALLSSRLLEAARQGLSHPHTARGRGRDIPKIIHQSWKNKDLPANFARWQKSWLDKHPAWEYRCALCRALCFAA